MKQHFCPVEKSIITYQDKCNWCGELESQEPVGWMNKHGACISDVFKKADSTYIQYTTPLYTAPPQRTWVGLTIEEISACCMESTTTQLSFYNAIEAKLKQKNGHAEEKNT
jgi:hypothetical protein